MDTGKQEQPHPTPQSGKKEIILIQFLTDHWVCIVLVLIAFLVGWFTRGLNS